MEQLNEIKADVVVLGSGPAGYTAAFRAADLGLKVVLIERHQNIGGVCLNVGCIPSKGYIHTVNVLHDMQSFKDRGIDFTLSGIDTKKLCEWKNSIVQRLSKGLVSLATKRNINVIQGVGAFANSNSVEVINDQGSCIVHFQHAIIAAGSRPRLLPNMPDDKRIMNSTDALELQNVACKLLVVGAGAIGLEMITIYAGLGAEITLVCVNEQLLSQVDNDLVVPLRRRMRKDCKQVLFKTKIKSVEAKQDGLYVWFEGEHENSEPEKFDRILYAIGREPNGHLIGAEKIGIKVDTAGFIQTDDQMRTNLSHIYAVGDVADYPMLAHKSFAQGRVAAEVIAGLNSHYNPVCVPRVCYTDPEIAWVGLTEQEAQSQGVNYGVSVFPWLACGKAVSIGRTDGLTKLIIEKPTNRVIGAGITGVNAGELIVELALAIELERTVDDVTRTIHPHPSLCETVMLAAEVYEKTVTDIFLSKG